MGRGQVLSLSADSPMEQAKNRWKKLTKGDDIFVVSSYLNNWNSWPYVQHSR